MKELDEAREELEKIIVFLVPEFERGDSTKRTYWVNKILNLKGDGWKIAIISTSAGVSRGYDDRNWKQVIWEGEE